MLPEAIWKRRLESEKAELQKAGVNFTASKDCTEFKIRFTARGFEKNNGAVTPRNAHEVTIKLFREFPYPGGIEVWWDTPIFHPNIDKDGRVCIQLLNEWSGMQSLVNVVEGLKRMVENPNPDSPLNTEAAKYFSEKKGNQTKETKPRIIY